MSARKVTATVNGVRYYAQPNNGDNGATVVVWTARGMIGGYRRERFGDTLTGASLHGVLTGQAATP